MAWRRGFFRLWLVLTIGWVGFIGYIHYADYRDAVAYMDRSSRVPILCHDARGEAGSDYGYTRLQAPGPWDRYKTDANPFDTCWVPMARYRALWPENAGQTDQQIITTGYTGIVNERAPLLYDPLDQFDGAWQFALIPPTALLAFGLVVGWIVSGFRRPTA